MLSGTFHVELSVPGPDSENARYWVIRCWFSRLNTSTSKASFLSAHSGRYSVFRLRISCQGVRPVEIPPMLDASSVFLARISIPANAGPPDQPPDYDLTSISVDNLKRLFLFPAALVARAIGLSSGTQS